VLEGDLGVGKTFLVRSVARALGVPVEIPVTSPTFELVHELPGRMPILHVDLYRLGAGDPLRDLGISDRIGHDAVALVEWGDRFARELGGEGLWLRIALDPAGVRQCTLEARGSLGKRLLGRIRAASGSA
jgi:tRNA threonylcarbamoyladenosine biosynthesis protein TsaE